AGDAGFPPGTRPQGAARRHRDQRVVDAAAALRRGDLLALGRLFADSHASMRDDYEITTSDVDALVGIAQHHPAVRAARMTGGGFGGAVVMIVQAGTANN